MLIHSFRVQKVHVLPLVIILDKMRMHSNAVEDRVNCFHMGSQLLASSVLPHVSLSSKKHCIYPHSIEIWNYPPHDVCRSVVHGDYKL